jgi:hypothetical protein
VRRRGAIAAALAVTTAAAGALAGVGSGDPTRSQEFFRAQVLADEHTSDEIVALLRHGGFVDKKITFDDLTGDGKQDAVVRVSSGGTPGIVAIYVFSSDGKKPSDDLRVALGRQRLVRASTKVSAKHVLSFRTRSYAPGDELCCPSTATEYTVTWDDATGKFVVSKPKDVS